MTKTPDLQRRHFQIIADAIEDYGYPQERQHLAEHFARKLRATNSGFDRDRFLRACGVSQ